MSLNCATFAGCPPLVDPNRDRCEDITVRIGLYFPGNTANAAARQKTLVEQFNNEQLADDYETQMNKAIGEQKLQTFLNEVHEEDVVWIVTGATTAPYGTTASNNGGQNDSQSNSAETALTPDTIGKDDDQLGGGPLVGIVAGGLFLLLLLTYFVRRRSKSSKGLQELEDNMSDLDSEDSTTENPSPHSGSEKTSSLGNGWVGGKSIDKEEEPPKTDSADWGPAPDYVPKQLPKGPTEANNESVDIDDEVWKGVLFADGDGEEDSEDEEEDEESVGVDSVTRRRRRRQKRLEAEEKFLSQQGAVWTAIEDDGEHSVARSGTFFDDVNVVHYNRSSRK